MSCIWHNIGTLRRDPVAEYGPASETRPAKAQSPRVQSEEELIWYAATQLGQPGVNIMLCTRQTGP